MNNKLFNKKYYVLLIALIIVLSLVFMFRAPVQEESQGQTQNINIGYDEFSPAFSIVNLDCYENFIEVVLFNTGNEDLDTTGAVMELHYVNGTSFNNITLDTSFILRSGDAEIINLTSSLLTLGERYSIKIIVSGYRQTDVCTTQPAI